MKKKLPIFAGIFAVVLIVALILFAQMFNLFEHVPMPEIRDGEFDFALTYEIDGEIKKIEGTYVCEFVKVTRAIDGIGRDWNGYIKGRDSANCVYDLKTTDEGTVKLDLDLNPQFFMSDPLYKSLENTDDPKPEPDIYVESADSYDNGETAYSATSDYLADNIKIISFEYDEPIENIYK